MKTNAVIFALSFLLLASCATSDSQIRDYLKKNPQVLFDVIEENPELFIETVNKAARKAQGANQEKQMADRQQRLDEQMKNPLKPIISKERLLAGNPQGKIVIVEYADFQCPACSMAATSLKTVLDKHKDKIQFYYKHMPLDFHPMAAPAARYYEALMIQDRAKAKKFYEQVFEGQKNLSEKYLKEIAKKTGADMNKLAADIKGEAVAKVLAEDREEFIQFGFTGTPVILVGGIALEGAQPPEAIERMMELLTKK